MSFIQALISLLELWILNHILGLGNIALKDQQLLMK